MVRSVRARLVTLITGMRSAAPAEVLRTVALIGAALSLGMITAVTPAAAALRRQAPRLCGSCTPSSTRISALPSAASIRPVSALSSTCFGAS